MKELLFLAHRIPFPPNKGDKIRSFNLLSYVARHYRVHLGTFVDAEADWDHRVALEALCGETCFVRLVPWRARLRSLSGLLSGDALSFPYYADRKLRAWVTDLLARRPIERIFVFSSPMAQYAAAAGGRRRVLDFCDVDSDKWRQYAASRGGALGWIYGRESRFLARAEARLADAFDASLFVSEHEAELFRRQWPDAAHKVFALLNGVDTDYFDPDSVYPRPFTHAGPVLVFTGAMDYWANVDAVTWCAREVLPQVRARRPDCAFYIVGSNPTGGVRALERYPGVTVTGAVADVRPYLAHASVAVAPLHIARGVQNKVLEAMAMERPVVATPAALDGIENGTVHGVQVASSPDAFARAILNVLDAPAHAQFGRGGREFVQARCAWSVNLRPALDMLEGSIAATPGSAPTRRSVG